MTDIDQNEELFANLFQQVEEEENEEIQVYSSMYTYIYVYLSLFCMMSLPKGHMTRSTLSNRVMCSISFI